MKVLHSLKSHRVYHRPAIHLGCSPTAESQRHLLKIVKSPIAKDVKEQALRVDSWKDDIAAHMEKRRGELCKTQR